MEVTIITAAVLDDAGMAVATIERVRIGGGVQTVTVDGVPEDRVHQSYWAFHVRLLSPDRMIADQFVEAATYEEACEVSLRYADKRAQHADRIAELAVDLRI